MDYDRVVSPTRSLPEVPTLIAGTPVVPAGWAIIASLPKDKYILIEMDDEWLVFTEMTTAFS
jgi:hypothetical protein